MKRNLIIGLLLTVVVGSGILLILNRQQVSENKKRAELRTAIAEKRDVTDILKLRGTIVAAKKVSIASEATGQIIKINARQGEKVEKGQVLIEIDPSLIKNKIEKQKISLEKDQITLDNMKIEYEREQALFKEQLTSESKMLESKKSLNLADLDYQMAKKEMDALNLQLQKVTLVSPISGIVTSRNVEEGAVVGNVSESGTSQPLLVITDVSHKTIELMVGDVERTSLTLGQEIDFWTDTDSDKHERGKVIKIAAAANQQSSASASDSAKSGTPGQFRVEISIEEPQENFTLDSNVTVKVKLQEALGVTAVPIEAIFKEGDEKFVYMVLKSGYEKRIVGTGVSNVNFSEIKKGLAEGDKVFLDEPESDEE